MTMTERAAKTYAAEQWIGSLLVEYVTGDPTLDNIADEFRAAAVANLTTRFDATFGSAELEVAQRLDSFAAAIKRASDAAVRAARVQHGKTWDQVGNAFGITRQAAHERWGR